MKRKRKYPLTATMLSKRTAWFYQTRSGLHVVAEKRDDAGVHQATAQCVIPWKLVAAAVANHRRRRR